MPPKSQLDESQYRCPECGEAETYVNVVNDVFLCSRCDYSVPIEKVSEQAHDG
jgi:ribosomal protein L37AE/L43A